MFSLLALPTNPLFSPTYPTVHDEPALAVALAGLNPTIRATLRREVEKAFPRITPHPVIGLMRFVDKVEHEDSLDVFALQLARLARAGDEHALDDALRCRAWLRGWFDVHPEFMKWKPVLYRVLEERAPRLGLSPQAPLEGNLQSGNAERATVLAAQLRVSEQLQAMRAHFRVWANEAVQQRDPKSRLGVRAEVELSHRAA